MSDSVTCTSDFIYFCFNQCRSLVIGSKLLVCRLVHILKIDNNKMESFLSLNSSVVIFFVWGWLIFKDSIWWSMWDLHCLAWYPLVLESFFNLKVAKSRPWKYLKSPRKCLVWSENFYCIILYGSQVLPWISVRILEF